jgi:glycyl-tRNA synthetase beta chain
MTQPPDFLVEIGTEELPPKVLRELMLAFGNELTAAIDDARLAHAAVHSYASPRRLAVLVENLAVQQEDRRSTQKGPPVSVAFDADGKLTAAGLAFAERCGVKPTALGREKTDRGEWLSCEVVEAGQGAIDLLPGLIEKALAALPIPRRMRWGAGDVEFVRPIHWVVLLHGKKVLSARVLGINAGRETRGHRFHCKRPLKIGQPADYLDTLMNEGHVIADFTRRRGVVRRGVEAEAARAGGHVVDGERLYDEVTALVEWPVAMTGEFDEAFLRLPREVVVSTLTSHQRYFPVAGDDGSLMPRFVVVANLESKDPEQVRDGNERVIRPRLADAGFFWDADRRTRLADRRDSLRDVVYQQGLGSLFDKSERTARLAASTAAALDVPPAAAERAARLAKCDLVTGMVGEFPELQGTMGSYYAAADGEPAEVAAAIGEQYLPRFAGDALPETVPGRILALADKLDTLAGVFCIGKRPSGNRDPYGLRRAALGIVRILVECGMDLDLTAQVARAVALQPAGGKGAEDSADAVVAFIGERLRRYFLDRDPGLATETFDAVLARQPASLVDFERRLCAVQAFLELDSAASLAAANKRIANILRQAGSSPQGGQRQRPAVREKLLSDPAELRLFAALGDARENVTPMLERRDYTTALTALAELREPVDRFFDDVMVMTDDDAMRNNRLALLGELRSLFLDVADISRLAI